MRDVHVVTCSGEVGRTKQTKCTVYGGGGDVWCCVFAAGERTGQLGSGDDRDEDEDRDRHIPPRQVKSISPPPCVWW